MKKTPKPTLPENKPPGHDQGGMQATPCSTISSLELPREKTCAEKLTFKIERHLRNIERERSEIKHHENQLAEHKSFLMTELLNHQATVHDLEKELQVPNQAH